MNSYAHSDRDTSRAPPRNIDAEQALLGAILVNNAAHARVAGFLRTEHFAEEINGRIFEVADRLIRDGAVANPITLRHYLGDHDLGGITVPAYLARLAAEATTIINAPDYGRIIVGLAVRRRLVDVAVELNGAAMDAPVGRTAEAIIEATEAALSDVRVRNLAHVRTTRIDAGAAALDVLAAADRIRSGEMQDEGVRIGFPSLDLDTGGLRPGDLWVVAGRASMGKSVFATALALGAARTGAGVLLWPLEIGERQATARLLAATAYSAHAPMTYAQVARGEYDDEGRARLGEAAARLREMPLVLDMVAATTLSAIAARVRAEADRMARRGVRLGAVILDYVAFVNASDRYKGQRAQEIGEVSVGLKQLAKSSGVAIVLLAQVNRQTENREDKRPTISDLRDSGSLEQDADVVALLYRDSYYIERSTAYQRGEPDAIVRANDARNELEVIVAKNRTGATRTHKLFVDMGASLVSSQARGWV